MLSCETVDGGYDPPDIISSSRAASLGPSLPARGDKTGSRQRNQLFRFLRRVIQGLATPTSRLIRRRDLTPADAGKSGIFSKKRPSSCRCRDSRTSSASYKREPRP